MSEPWTSEHLGVPEYNPADAPICRINIGTNNVVEIDKLYGPWATHPIRVLLDFDPGEWVIQIDRGDGESNWVEIARFSASA